jgi:molecular chaperone GrpE
VSTKGDGSDEELPVVAKDAPAAEEALEPAQDATAPPEAEATALAEKPPADELEALRQECTELRGALLRRRADFENYRRRVERDRLSAAVEAEAGILRQMLGTVDNLERALAASGADSGLREGVALTLRELLTLLESVGVAVVNPLGERFDPALHQAILHEPAPGFEPGCVAEVLRKGYTYKDRLLRPALVKVASGGSSRPGEGGGDVQ